MNDKSRALWTDPWRGLSTARLHITSPLKPKRMGRDLHAAAVRSQVHVVTAFETAGSGVNPTSSSVLDPSRRVYLNPFKHVVRVTLPGRIAYVWHFCTVLE